MSVGEPIGDTGWVLVLVDVRRDAAHRGKPYVLIMFERSGQMWRLDLRPR